MEWEPGRLQLPDLKIYAVLFYPRQFYLFLDTWCNNLYVHKREVEGGSVVLIVKDKLLICPSAR